jgi:hypothetical protein
LLNVITGILAPPVPAPSNSYESIATGVGTGSSGTINFGSIPSTYKHLQIRGIVKTDVSGKLITLQFNSDATSGNYTTHVLSGNGSNPVKASAFATSQTYGRLFGLDVGTDSTNPTAIVIDILDYGNTSKYKTVRTLAGLDNNGSGEVMLSSNLWLSTSAVSSITLGLNSGNYGTHTSFALYGIKG